MKMEQPKKYLLEYGRAQGYLCTDIDPLLDELERLKADKKPFPSY